MKKTKYSIAILLPYKEIYSTNFSGAASIWVKDYLRKSLLTKKTVVYGYLEEKLKPLTKNFKNLFFKKTIFSKSKSYAQNFLNDCKKNKIVPGIHNQKPEYAEKMIKKGFQLVTVGSDQRFMSSGAKESISKLKKTSFKEGKGY